MQGWYENEDLLYLFMYILSGHLVSLGIGPHFVH